MSSWVFEGCCSFWVDEAVREAAERVSPLFPGCGFLRGLPSAVKTYSGWWMGPPRVRLSLSPVLPHSFLLLPLSLRARVCILSLINTSGFCFFDCLGHAGNFRFLLLSASSGQMCTQRQNGFQRRLRPPLGAWCRHQIEGRSAVPDAGSQQPGD